MSDFCNNFSSLLPWEKMATLDEREALYLAIVKCPRCELNYILDGAMLCPVCQRETKGEAAREALELCPICNENPGLPGKDMCLFCLKEMEESESEKNAAQKDALGNPLAPEGASEIDEIDLDDKDGAPDPEMDEIERELSLEDVLAEENEGAEDEDAPEDSM